ncbi:MULTISPECIES: class I SAM-dependent methyltransferase [unclassified Nocardioides]|uniref:class I SAM-dependent methyltransferase n=1 Tax=unclassified Nocardioides TaxID=2615069 RepID=UPI0006FE6432|nr:MULTISPECIES: SAM-dependent methyltransferase [unclassified Nocardioides]KRA30895.1 glutathione S-transferase [Nocardioides sp. Root614]KRA87515.1 glutathione S-transferase [Nocardioides sp. Root682]
MSSSTESLEDGLARVAQDLLAEDRLVRAVGSGRRRTAVPPWRRVELRWVDLKAGRHLQIVRYDATQAHTANHLAGEAAHEAVTELLAEPFGNWTVETTEHALSLRVTKKGDAALHVRASTGSASGEETAPDRSHDRAKERMLPADDPVFAALGMTDGQGRIKPSRMAKYRQVEDFLRILDRSVADARAKGHLREPTEERPLHVVDLGCGNGYLTFAAHRMLSGRSGLPVRLTGVDVKEQSRDHNASVAAKLGIDAEFVAGTIGGAALATPPDVVLALHACDTATDDALARAVAWEAPLVLAAPCCHHDIASQLRRTPAPAPYSALVRDGILRERFADTLTDALRSLLLRQQGYRVDVMEFVDSQHTPRNTLLRAVRTGDVTDTGPAVEEYDALVATWAIRPRLGELLGHAPAPEA